MNATDIALALWWGVVLAVVAFCLGAWQASGMEMSITGYSVGQGMHTMYLAGDNLSVAMNGSYWNITAVI